MKNILLTLVMLLSQIGILSSQIVKFECDNHPRKVSIYDRFDLKFNLINQSNHPIWASETRPLWFKYESDSDKWQPLLFGIFGSHCGGYSPPIKINAGDTLVLEAESISFYHPLFNDALYEEFTTAKSIQIKASFNYFLDTTWSKLTTVESNVIKFKTVSPPSIEQKFVSWANEHKLFLAYNSMDFVSSISERYGWPRKSSDPPLLYHNMTEKDLMEAMSLFPKSKMLGRTIRSYMIENSIFRYSNPLMLSVLKYVGELGDKYLLNYYKNNVDDICTVLSSPNLSDELFLNEDHTCEAYKTLAPLYGLPD